MCGEQTESSTFAVGGMPDGDGGMITTKQNTKVECPEHGELYVK